MAHHCAMTLFQPRGWTPAIEQCMEDEKTGEFTVGNGEYGNEVRFCPECGAMSPAETRRRHERLIDSTIRAPLPKMIHE
jgi:hypothetical protein